MKNVSVRACKNASSMLLGVNKQVWFQGGTVYVADKRGYEGLSEYVVSRFLQESSLKKEEYLIYQTEEIQYLNSKSTGSKAKWDIDASWEVVSLKDIFYEEYGFGIYSLFKDKATAYDRLKSLVTITQNITKLNKSGEYIGKLILIDALFLNTSRAVENIFFLRDKCGNYSMCPLLNFGEAFLSDTLLRNEDSESVASDINSSYANFLCRDFDEEIKAVEAMYGQIIKFSIDIDLVDKILKEEKIYSYKFKKRIKDILLIRMKKYSRYFNKNRSVSKKEANRTSTEQTTYELVAEDSEVYNK